jgi:hypothetical protein
MGKITSDDIQYKLEEINDLLGKNMRWNIPRRRGTGVPTRRSFQKGSSWP